MLPMPPTSNKAKRNIEGFNSIEQKVFENDEDLNNLRPKLEKFRSKEL